MKNTNQKHWLCVASLTLMLCAWYPTSNPVLVKLFFLPLLLFLPLGKYGKNSLPPLLGLFTLFLIILFQSLTLDDLQYHFRYYFAHFFLILAWLAGTRIELKSLRLPFLVTAAINLIFILAQNYGHFPWEISQPMILKDQIFLAQTFNHPGLFSNPSPMALCLFLGMLALRSSRWQEKVLYLLLIGFPMIQADTSSSFIFLIAGGFLLFATERIHRIGARSLKFASIGLLVILAVFFFTAREGSLDRTYSSRVFLWNIALDEVSFSGRGPGHFHQVSSSKLPAQTGKKRIPRNQFHPHNDLLYHLLSFGLPGLLLQLAFYLILLYCFYKSSLLWFGVLILAEAQFTPNLLSIPAGILIFLITGSLSRKLERPGWTGIVRTFPDWVTIAIQKTFPNSISPKLHRSLLIFLGLLSYTLLSLQIHQSSKLRELMESPDSKAARSKSWMHFPTPALDYNFAVAAYKRGDYETAIAQFEKLHKRAPHFSYSHYIHSLALAQNGQLEKAYKILENGIKIDPFHLYSYLLLSDIYEKTDQLDKAVKIIEEGVKCLGDHPQLINARRKLSQ